MKAARKGGILFTLLAYAMPLIQPRPLKVDTTQCFLPADYIKKKEVGASLRTVYRRMKGEAQPPLPTIEISGVEFIYLG